MVDLNKMINKLRIWLVAESCKNRHKDIKTYVRQAVNILNDTSMDDISKWSSIMVGAGVYVGSERYGDKLPNGEFQKWFIEDFNTKLDEITRSL